MSLKKVNSIIKQKGLTGFIRIFIRVLDDKTGLISFLALPYTVYIIRNMELKELLDKLFDEASIFSILYRPMQVKWEIEKLCQILLNIKPNYILEIGTARGGTLLLWTRVAQNDALIISVDMPNGPFGGGYPVLKGITFRFLARNNQKVILIRGDSHSDKTLKRVEKILSGEKLDFLFIDGDHTYKGVKTDFETYSRLVKENGIIALHDIVPHDLKYDRKQIVGVPSFWEEIKLKFKNNYKEIVKNWHQGWGGIGLIWK